MPWPARMTLTISIAVLPLYLYIGWRIGTAIIQQFQLRAGYVRPIIFALTLWMYLLPLYYYITPSAGYFTELPQTGWRDYLILFPFWYGLVIMVESFPYILLGDIIGVFLKIKKSVHTEKWKARLNIVKMILFVCFIIYVPLRSYTDTNSVRLRETTLKIAGLPDALDGLKLSLIADVQVDRYTQAEKLTAMRELLEESDPEMLFFAGDIVTSGEMFIKQSVEALCSLESIKMRAACMGDHDFWSDEISIQRGLEICGWSFLDNQHKLFEHQGKQILVSGVTHIYSRKIPTDQLKAFLASAPAADYKIILVHQPAEFLVETAAEYGYNLFLAGHTHGGQIVFNPFGFPLTPSQRETKYYSGHFKVNKMDVVVSNGIGLTLAPVRYHSGAEIYLMELNQDN